MLKTVAEGVHVHHSELLANNTVVIEGAGGALLVDPGLTGAEFACLAGDLRERGLRIVAGFATHPDWDHALWDDALGDVPRYGTARCAARAAEFRSDPEWRARFIEGLPPEIAGEVPVEPFGLLTALPEGATRIPWDGPELRVIEHAAHAPGHAALFLADHGVLVAGDMLSDVFVSMFDEPDGTDRPLEDYLAALDRFEALAEAVEVLVPGHGSPGDGAETARRIAADRAYVRSVIDGTASDDPRIGPDAAPGWEWVADIDAGQRAAFPRG